MRTRRATSRPGALEPQPAAPATDQPARRADQPAHPAEPAAREAEQPAHPAEAADRPARAGRRARRHLHRHARATPGRLRRFWQLAWDSNITGLAAMLAYNMLLGIIPVALLGLFVAGHIVSDQSIAHSVVVDLRDIFPGSTQHTLDSLLDEVARSTTSTGVLALIASLWLASSFWGALDTSFSRIYGSPSRPWLVQKAFGVVMVGIVLLFMIATVAIPTLQSLIKAGARQLPLDLARVTDLAYVISLAGSLAILFICLAAIYAAVPTRRLRWRAIWPGALGATIAIGAVDVAFPVYLSSISTIARFGTTVVFVVIVLGWFYVVALLILAGGVVNALAAGPQIVRPPEAAPPAPGAAPPAPGAAPPTPGAGPPQPAGDPDGSGSG